MSRVFRLTLETENDAFTDGNAGQEVARILRRLADKLEDVGYDAGTLADANGNLCGSFSWLEDGTTGQATDRQVIAD